jgi:hypothetical protein
MLLRTLGVQKTLHGLVAHRPLQRQHLVGLQTRKIGFALDGGQRHRAYVQLAFLWGGCRRSLARRGFILRRGGMGRRHFDSFAVRSVKIAGVKLEGLDVGAATLNEVRDQYNASRS